MIPKPICLVIDLQCFIVLSFRESFFLTIIRPTRSSVSVFPLEFCPGGLRCSNIESVRLQHRRIRESDINFSKSKKSFQIQIWDPGVPNHGFTNDGLRLWTDYINENRFMFVSATDISVLPVMKALVISFIGGTIFFSSPIVSFGFREALLGFKTRDINLNHEPMALSQSSEEEMNLVIQRGIWFFADWMIRIHQWSTNIQDEVLKLIPLWIQEWGISVGYLTRHIIGVIREANQIVEDYMSVSDSVQSVEDQDLVVEKIHYRKAALAKDQFINSDFVFVFAECGEFSGFKKRKMQDHKEIEEMLLN